MNAAPYPGRPTLAADYQAARPDEDRPGGPLGGDRSWWFTDAAADNRAAFGSLRGPKLVDVAIVGGGYTGLWTAIELRRRRPDLTVALIERDVCGAGASGKNAGKVHGYWAALPHLADLLGPEQAWSMARMGSRAQDAIRNFSLSGGRDVWWREGGGLKISCAPAQDRRIASLAAAMTKLGAGGMVRVLSPEQVADYCRSPVFRGGLFYREEATVHPARLAMALRDAAVAAGVAIHERTPMLRLERGRPNRIVTPGGELAAASVVLATNVDLLAFRRLRSRFMAFSSYALMTEPAEGTLDAARWRRDHSITDARSFLHYFRRTPDGRVLMGSGSGPIAFGANVAAPSVVRDASSLDRTVRGLRRLLPSHDKVAVASAWGAAIDVSSDRLPYAGTLTGGGVHYAFGFTGHGVNPSYIIGQCLASLTLGQKDDWTLSPFCARALPPLPPEPFRYVGGAIIRKATLSCEDAEERGARGSTIARALAAAPALFNLRIGTR
ncbi:NAD(P)/FAD-dependent oxidoreductase [Hansschlegelia plantiphila]|uniref:FAD dependent oxidoreductase domain-containing protein n=1 Tax=Hansschlegelia plantiphila TaxID=374655 RepID=A0A9W6J388_9HYPH|nr:FAD-dependent oxidoreductase [Hansschlegelia plantiphila]GLK69872.1 hypothetical protein GCM10008179_35100 [Hansschlegelia plantiphila]